MKYYITMLSLICMAVCLSALQAKEGPYIPAQLQPWTDWVLEDQQDIHCPYAYNDHNDRMCVWATGLDLKAGRTTASFTQNWTIYGRSRVFLPGDSRHWPQDVTVNGRPVPVVLYASRPVVYLDPGQYLVKGAFRWDTRPKSLRIPDGTALITLTLDGKKVDHLNVDDTGILWFGGSSEAGRTEAVRNEQEVRVYRQIIDEVPLRIITRVHLEVSGQERELVMGRILPKNAKVIKLVCDLPARIEKDGSLRIQVSTGTWVVEMHSRQTGAAARLVMERLDTVWPEEEIWVFRSQPALRSVELTGAPTVDPRQTDLPDEWKSLPAYLLTPGNGLVFKEKHRGDHTPSPSRLDIDRTFWLDFNGKGFTVKDAITGDVSRSLRMEMDKGFRLGRAELDGTPQLITVGKDSVPGLEVREGLVNLEAVSRYRQAKTGISATGWNHDAVSLRGSLHLPPGWSLLHAGGPDRANGSLVAQWSIWDLFLVFIIAVIMVKLLGPGWGVLAGITLLLTYHVPGGPVYTWVNVAAALFLLKVIPEGRFRKFMVWYRNIAFLILFGWVLTFSVSQVRKGLYPQLELRESGIGDYFFGGREEVIVDCMVGAQKAAPPPPHKAPPRVKMKKPPKVKPDFSLKSSEVRPMIKKARGSRRGRTLDKVLSGTGGISSSYYKQRMDRMDASAKIQTGPGEPDWSWKDAGLVWNGPVSKDQRLRLFLISPGVNRILNFIRVLAVITLAAALVFNAAGRIFSFGAIKRILVKSIRPATVLLLLGMMLTPQKAYAAFPSDSLLADLKSRLTRKPECGSVCAAVSRGLVSIRGGHLSIRLVIDAAGDVYVPLPASRTTWFPRTVMLDGKPARALENMGKEGLAAAVTCGRHTVVLEGPVSGAAVEIPFTSDPHNISVDARGWDYSGLIKGRVPGGSLQFAKHAGSKSRTKREKILLPDPADPFLEVERFLTLDKEWTIVTTVRRIAPEYGAINIEVPLLAYESVLSAGITVVKNRVKVTMASTRQEFSWHSSLKKTDEISLKAPDAGQWVEIWKSDVATRWHTDYRGIAKIKKNISAEMIPEWHPRPGEELILEVTRPEGLEGATKTIENASLTYEPGKRSAAVGLDLKIRSSQGGQMTVTLPEEADVQQLKIGFNEQVISRQKNRVTIPLKPGIQNIGLKWKEKRGVSLFTRTPVVDLHGPVANINLTMRNMARRWTLVVGGPRLGPAMLYWGMLTVLVMLAFVLGRLPQSPIKSRQWLLIFIGMSTISRFGGLFVIAWFFALAKRKDSGRDLQPNLFNLMQTGLIILTVAALVSIIKTVPQGLLGYPDMLITGNGSGSHQLCWYQDQASGALPYGWFISLPMWVYRAVMLAWSLWLAFSLIGWLRWGWECFSSYALWKKDPKIETKEKEVPVLPIGKKDKKPEGE